MSRRVVTAAMLLAGSLLASLPAQAQEPQIDPAHSATLIRSLSYPEVNVAVTPNGVEAPAELPAGPTLITLEASEGLTGYVDIMLPPPGLSEEDATELTLAAAANDLAQPDWVYLGGTNTPNPNETATFVIDLRPGEYQWAASIYGEGGADEVMFLEPLTVRAGDAATSATPVATHVAALPQPGIVLERTDDLAYIVTPDPAPSGPQIWEFANTGQHSAHHVVMNRVPDGTTSEEIIAEYAGLMAGTPPAGGSIVSQLQWVGYAAIQSGGQTTWAEFDLSPATYAVICFIIDPATGRPQDSDDLYRRLTGDERSISEGRGGDIVTRSPPRRSLLQRWLRHRRSTRHPDYSTWALPCAPMPRPACRASPAASGRSWRCSAIA
jgi:hypothetical protein